MEGREQPDPSPASLQRLLALDKTFDTLDQRVEEAARILGISLVTARECPETYTSAASPASAQHGARHEFVLRWLLDKIRTQPNAHASRPAWTLLRCLVQLSTPASLVKALGGLPFTPTLVDALEKTFPGDPLPSSNVASLETADDENALPSGTPSQVESTTVLSTKKRKRSAENKGDATGPPGMLPDAMENHGTILDISAILRVFVKTSTSRASAATQALHYQVQSILGLNMRDLVRLIKHWLIALIPPATASGLFQSAAWLKFVNHSLTILLDVWALQPALQNSDKDALSEAFCRNCLWSATSLLASLQSTKLSDGEHAGAVLILERIIAQQVFVPARAAFIDKREVLQTPLRKRAHPDHPNLEELIQPLRLDTTLANPQAEKAYSEMLRVAVPALLDIAVRCTPASTPKSRIAEGPWVNSLFTCLAGLLGKNEEHHDTHVREQGNAAYVDMLAIVKSRGLSLEKDTLVDAVNDRCHLTSKNLNPDFNLVAMVLSMDASIFTDVESAHSQALFNALTVVGKVDRSVLPADEERTVVALSKSVAIPLLKAFSRVRNVRGFLDEWYVRLSSDPTWRDQDWCLWTATDLLDSVGDVLESCMTPAQVFEILQLRCMPITSLAVAVSDGHNNGTHLDSVSHEAFQEAHASSILLSAIIGAVRSDEFIDTLTPALHSLIADVERGFEHIPARTGQGSGHLLLLLSRSYDLWYPRWSISQEPHEISTQALATLGGSAVRHALNIIYSGEHLALSLRKQNDEADLAFLFIANLCALHRRLSANTVDLKEKITALMCIAAFGSDDTTVQNGKAYAKTRPGQFGAVMARFPSLLECIRLRGLGGEAFHQLLHLHLSLPDSNQAILHELVASVASSEHDQVKNDLFDEVVRRLTNSSHDTADTQSAVQILLRWPVRSMSRQQRETALDSALDVVTLSANSMASSRLEEYMSLAVTLMALPNATARFATDPSIIFTLADSVPFSKDDATNNTMLCLLNELCSLLLRHILDTKEQTRSKAFIERFSTLAAEIMKRKKDRTTLAGAGQMSLLTTFFGATETRLTGNDLAPLPHRSPAIVDAFIKQLYTLLSKFSTSYTSATEIDGLAAGAAIAINVFAGLPVTLLDCGGSSATRYAQKMSKLLGELLASTGETSDEKNSIPFPMLVSCFQQISLSLAQENPLRLFAISENLLVRGPDAKEHRSIMHSFAVAIRDESDVNKIELVEKLLRACTPKDFSAEGIALIQRIISSLHPYKSSGQAYTSGVHVRILELLSGEVTYEVHVQLMRCLNTILRDKPNLVSQYSLEMTVETMISLASPCSSRHDDRRSSAYFEGLCTITQSLLQFHRASLGGRLHLFIPLVQRLLACLFTPISNDIATKGRFKHPSWLSTLVHPLTVRHSHRFSRLLTLLCNPPQSNSAGHRKKHDTASELVDETRKLRIQVGQHVHQILHYFCVLILNGKLGEGMRDSLKPGLWAVIEVIEMDANESKGVKALSACMGNAERAVLRGIWEEYRRFGGAWKG
ncbi:hypothetical protein MBLNU459_g1021t1 [Dothideomycetes sp. NU459]